MPANDRWDLTWRIKLKGLAFSSRMTRIIKDKMGSIFIAI
jgi:hypothetical protein